MPPKILYSWFFPKVNTDLLTSNTASCAFVLPVATVPNAIVFGTGHITIKEMVQGGFVLNLILAVVITLVSYLALA